MNADSRSSARDATVLAAEPATRCTECPICGSEECLMLEDLGNYCSTMTAASLAREKEGAVEKAR